MHEGICWSLVARDRSSIVWKAGARKGFLGEFAQEWEPLLPDESLRNAPFLVAKGRGINTMNRFMYPCEESTGPDAGGLRLGSVPFLVGYQSF